MLSNIRSRCLLPSRFNWTKIKLGHKICCRKLSCVSAWNYKTLTNKIVSRWYSSPPKCVLGRRDWECPSKDLYFPWNLLFPPYRDSVHRLNSQRYCKNNFHRVFECLETYYARIKLFFFSRKGFLLPRSIFGAKVLQSSKRWKLGSRPPFEIRKRVQRNLFNPWNLSIFAHRLVLRHE